MKPINLIIVFVLMITSLKAQKESDIIGKWESDAKDFRLEFFQTGSEYQAKTLWGNKIVEADGKTSKKDTKNPNEKLRTRNIIGIISMTELKWDDDEYTNGKMYNPLDGDTYSGKVWIKDEKLYLRAYLGVSLLGKTISFHRYNQ